MEEVMGGSFGIYFNKEVSCQLLCSFPLPTSDYVNMLLVGGVDPADEDEA